MAENNLKLGLDLGIGSLGWSLLDFQTKKIIDGGVILWDIPQEDKTNASLCAKRRGFRSVRRNLSRKRNRKKHCIKFLKRYNLMPSNANANWLQTKKGEKQPYLLRVDALERKLTNRQLCQMLYGFCSLRGYINHGTDSSDKNSDDGKVLKAIAENSKLLEEQKAKTYSQAMVQSTKTQKYTNGKWRNKAGDYANCFSKEMMLHDLDIILDTQFKLGNSMLDSAFKQEFLQLLYWEKVDASYDWKIYKKVGKCVYFPEEIRAARCSFSNEYMSAWAKFKNIRIAPYEGEEYELDEGTIKKCLDILFSPSQIPKNKSCKVTYSSLKKMLKLNGRESFKSIDENDEKTEIFVPKGFRTLRDCLCSNKANSSMATGLLQKLAGNRHLCDQVMEALTFASHENSIEAWLSELIESGQLTAGEIDCLKQLPFNGKVFKGYANRSLKALDALYEAIQNNNCTNIYDAENFAGLKKYKCNNGRGFLPAYEKSADSTCTNPVVIRCMANLRKLVNNIVKKYGTPNQVHIELGTELKRSKKEKKVIEKNNKERNVQKTAVAKALAEILNCKPDGVPDKLIAKEILRQQQNQKDLILGKTIGINDLVTNERLYEVDHILPYSRTFDNSQSNKHLVLAKTNKLKSNKSPFEYIANGDPNSQAWIKFKNTILDKTIKLPYKKKQKLLCENLKDKESDFISRNLNDTRYASKLAKSYLEDYLNFPEDGHQHVFCNAGGVTAKLRHAWGLGIKNRNDDNRHHFVDACLIAACSQSAVQKVAKVHKATPRLHTKEALEAAKDQYKKALFNTQPWEGFAKDVLNYKDNIYAVRRSSHKLQGKMFEDTLYGFDGINEQNNKANVHYTKNGTKTESVKGNFVEVSSKTVKARGEQAFLRLWWDPECTKKCGRYLKEVVFKADLAAIKNGSYKPKYKPSKQMHRDLWPEVPQRAKQSQPVTIFCGDCVNVNGEILRYVSTGIASGKVDFHTMFNEKNVTPKTTFTKLNPETAPIKVINEDILGECFNKNLEE